MWKSEVFVAKVITKYGNIFYKVILMKFNSQSCGHTVLLLLNRRVNPLLS